MQTIHRWMEFCIWLLRICSPDLFYLRVAAHVKDELAKDLGIPSENWNVLFMLV